MKAQKNNRLTSFSLLFLALVIIASGCEESTETEDNTPETSSMDPIQIEYSYTIVGTAQAEFYDDAGPISEPSTSREYYGQNAHYPGNVMDYLDNGDGSVTDKVSGLVWEKSCDRNQDGIINASDKMTYDEAVAAAATVSTGGFDDWRLPNIKELYSLMAFTGVDPSGTSLDESELIPFINTRFFEIGFGDTDSGERIIDSQFATSTIYTSTTMNGNETMFGVNLVDGRIKGYPTGGSQLQPDGKLYYVLYVRGNTAYGINDYVDNGNGTISDKATGLMWMQDDSGEGMNWKAALAYAEEFEYAGYSDWRLPDAKELQSIVDYSLSPDASGTAAIDPVFSCTAIQNEAGQIDYACYWTSTTHANGSNDPGSNAAYLSFGRAMGYFMNSWIDVHGAGAQRSDPKSGDASAYPYGHGPQGDAIRINNWVRLVRYDK